MIKMKKKIMGIALATTIGVTGVSSAGLSASADINPLNPTVSEGTTVTTGSKPYSFPIKNSSGKQVSVSVKKGKIYQGRTNKTYTGTLKSAKGSVYKVKSGLIYNSAGKKKVSGKITIHDSVSNLGKSDEQYDKRVYTVKSGKVVSIYHKFKTIE